MLTKLYVSKDNKINYSILDSILSNFIEKYKDRLKEFICQISNKIIYIKKENDFYVYYENKLLKLKEEIKVPIYFNKIIYKSIDSFDQNNKFISNNIRKTVLSYIYYSNSKNIIGIGGEYYLYFVNLKKDLYIGLSNHQSIINDANYNMELYKINNYYNHLVNYNNTSYYSFINKSIEYDCIINLISFPITVINLLNNLNISNLIVIFCKDFKIITDKLTNYKLIKINRFININSFITIGLFRKKLI